jgi:DNA repair exonuclease SbcCD nuclease subunit
MSTTFIHTADWQLGKPFAGVTDPAKRALLQNERFQAIRRIGDLARTRGAKFVVVAGDLFDSPQPTQSTVASACSAIGELGVPVYAIPGNHDHGGAGSLWTEPFFLRESAGLAPNLKMLLEDIPLTTDDAVLFPCPLVRRQTASDPTTWLRDPSLFEAIPTGRPRIVVAHGSVQDFGPAAIDDEDLNGAGQPNLIELDRLPSAAIDYVALGDWHGTKKVDHAAWYSGTPELDRFVRGDDHDPGNVLVVTAARGLPPQVETVRTGTIGWHDLDFEFLAGLGPDHLAERLNPLIGTRANRDLLRLGLRGSLSLGDMRALEGLLEGWEARLLRMKLTRVIGLVPTEEERRALTERSSDPLIARVATQLLSQASGDDESAEVARIALRELHVRLHTLNHTA